MNNPRSSGTLPGGPPEQTSTHGERSAEAAAGARCESPLLHIADFLFLAPREFVAAAYQRMCGRPATAEEIEHGLREIAGSGDRLLVLQRLRSTEEGRRTGASVRGLATYMIAVRLSGIPLIGRPLAALTRQLALPAFTLAKSASASLARRFADIDRSAAYTQRSVQGQLEGLNSLLASLDASQSRRGRDIESLVRRAHELEARIHALAKETQAIGRRTEAMAALSPPGERHATEVPGDHDVDRYYVSFEDRHRGSREEIKQRLSVYLQMLDADSVRTLDAPALDLGCGRGEWLELLRDQGFAARGIDSNKVMIERCRSAGLDVVEGEVKSYLACLPEASFSVVSGFHIVEHLPFADVLSLLDQALRVLKPGGMLILETPNPENVVVGSCNFYFDPTHRNPLPPEALRFAVSSRGFERDEILRLHPPEALPGESWEGVPVRVANAFQVGQDYAVIARKPGK